MLVVVGIIAFVSSVMIFNYSDFSSNVSLRNLTQEVALSVRKAQTYATSVRPIEGLQGLTSRAFGSYGISFSLDGTTEEYLPNPKKFVLFADIPPVAQTPDGLYLHTTGACGNPETFESECIETFGITTADKIVELCGQIGNGNEDCTTRGNLDITYRRPNPDAVIYYRTTPNSAPKLSPYAKIILESAKGLRRSVTVWNTGQISVQ